MMSGEMSAVLYYRPFSMSLYQAAGITLCAFFWHLASTHLSASMTDKHTLSAALCEKQGLHALQYKISVLSHDMLRVLLLMQCQLLARRHNGHLCCT